MDKEAEKLAEDVFSYIKAEKIAYETTGVPMTSNWEWRMFDHINRSLSLVNSKFITGNNDGTRPFDNIIIPIRNVNLRTEGFDVKDADLYVDDPNYQHLSLLGRKYYVKWALENKLDTAIDESVESHFDYGLILAKNVDDKKPEIVPLQRIAFCDQSDIMAGPICEKHDYSIDQMDAMKGKWYEDEVEMAILHAKKGKNVSLAKKDAKTPGKYVEVYELEGVFPKTWLNTDDNEEYTEEDGYCRQMHIITFYKSSEGKDAGICLFKGIQKESKYKAYKRTSRYGTACGMGGVEELFDAQTWTNSSAIHLENMLQAASKIVLQTASAKFAVENDMNDVDNNYIMVHEEGKPLTQVPLQPINKGAFDNSVNKWEQRANALGSASDPQLGKNPVSGTPLGTTEIVTAQGEGIHEYRQGKIADFWHEIHADWIINYLMRDINKGDQWLEELSLEELQEVAEKVTINTSNQRIAEMVANGREVTPDEQALMMQLIKEDFVKGGKKKFMKIMKDEFKKMPIKIKFNIAGKQKNMAEYVQKLNGIFRTVFSNPAILQAPGMSKLFNEILEHSGLSPIDFSQLSGAPQQGLLPQGGGMGQQGAQSPMQGELVAQPQ